MFLRAKKDELSEIIYNPNVVNPLIMGKRTLKTLVNAFVMENLDIAFCVQFASLFNRKVGIQIS